MIYIVKQNGEECTSENFPDQKQGVLSAKFRSYKDAVRFLWFWDSRTSSCRPEIGQELLIEIWDTSLMEYYPQQIYKIEIQENK